MTTSSKSVKIIGIAFENTGIYMYMYMYFLVENQ